MRIMGSAIGMTTTAVPFYYMLLTKKDSTQACTHRLRLAVSLIWALERLLLCLCCLQCACEGCFLAVFWKQEEEEEDYRFLPAI